jgi:hypothetical protein
MCSINRAISIPVIVALIFSVAAWSKNFAGVYVRDSTKRDYLELRSDVTFFLREHGLGLARKNESAARSTVHLLNTAEITYQWAYPSQAMRQVSLFWAPGHRPSTVRTQRTSTLITHVWSTACLAALPPGVSKVVTATLS